MTDEQPTPPAADEAPGWQVIDPDGNVIDSGPIVYAQPVTGAGETADEDQENN